MSTYNLRWLPSNQKSRCDVHKNDRRPHNHLLLHHLPVHSALQPTPYHRGPIGAFGALCRLRLMVVAVGRFSQVRGNALHSPLTLALLPLLPLEHPPSPPPTTYSNPHYSWKAKRKQNRLSIFSSGSRPWSAYSRARVCISSPASWSLPSVLKPRSHTLPRLHPWGFRSSSSSRNRRWPRFERGEEGGKDGMRWEGDS